MTDQSTATATATDDQTEFSADDAQNLEEALSTGFSGSDDSDADEHPVTAEVIEVPVSGADADYTKPMTLGDFGGDLKEVPPSWVKVGSKPTTLRILYRMPTPKGYEPGNDQGRIPVYARFKVQYHQTNEERVWDVSSKRLLALLAGVPNLREWFHVTRQGSGAATTYTVTPGVAPSKR